MPSPDRRIRHLRLAARDAADVRNVLPRLEDALRCASLPDGGEQVLLVRKLALGRLPRAASAQTLSLLIERRVAEVGGSWREGGEAAAERADFVRFPSHFEARVRLALRLARGETATAWYWRLALPEFRPEYPAAENLRGIARALAELPEARAALPAWARRLVEAGAAPALIAAIPETLGSSLLRQAGIGPIATRGATLAGARPGGPPAIWPNWLRGLPGRPNGAGRGEADFTREVGAEVGTKVSTEVESKAVPADASHRDADLAEDIDLEKRGGRSSAPIFAPGDQRPSDTAPRVTSPPSPRLAPGQPVHSGRPGDDPSHAATAETGGGTDARGEAGKPDAAAAPAPPQATQTAGDLTRGALPWLAPTRAGGLLFLLPLLARLGIASWSEAHGAAGEDFARRVLARAARRLRTAGDDPIWRALESAPGNPRRRAPAAPAAWADPLLAPPRARRAVGDLAASLARAGGLDAQADVFLTAARRWLRRGGIGLASLVLRPARVSVTATHVDLHFRLRDADPRARRLGLDLDPGWLPWFGRVVAFHFDLEARDGPHAHDHSPPGTAPTLRHPEGAA